jgi:hypothetical protein
MALAVALACCLPGGCGAPANEDDFTKGGQDQAATRPADMPNFTSQGEYEQWRAQQAAKNKSQAKGQAPGKR